MLAIVVLFATDQILPPTSDRQAELRFWLAARATGIVAFLLLTLQVVFGLVLSHPHNKTTWKLSRRVFPWHDHLWVFVMAFLAAHIVSLVADPKSGVDLLGAVVPGLSELPRLGRGPGHPGAYAFLVTAITARWTKLLPPGAWLALHRLAIVIYVLAWLHGMLAGTDSSALRPVYVASAGGRRAGRRLPLLGARVEPGPPSPPRSRRVPSDDRHIHPAAPRLVVVGVVAADRPGRPCPSGPPPRGPRRRPR